MDVSLKSAALAAAIVLAPLAAQGQDGMAALPAVADVAPSAVQISPHVPGMGEHWADPANLPGGPIYCVVEGRVVCVEYMFDMADLEQGVDFTALVPGIQTPEISHIDVEFKPEGIEPHPVPLYQLHIYFADADDLAAH